MSQQVYFRNLLNENARPQKTHTQMLAAFIHNSKKVEAIQMSISWWKAKQDIL